MCLPASVGLNGTSLSHICLKNRTRSLTLISVMRDNFINIFPKYNSRANTLISEHRFGRTSRHMGKPPKVLYARFYPTPQCSHAPPLFLPILPSKVQNLRYKTLLKSVFKMGSVVSPNPEINYFFF